MLKTKDKRVVYSISTPEVYVSCKHKQMNRNEPQQAADKRRYNNRGFELAKWWM